MKGHDFDAIRESNPLAEVVGAVVPLKKHGRWWEGCCPFHEERNPSFKFKDGDEHWHCFGCSAHGDVIDFVEKIDGGTTAEAIAKLTGGKAVSLSDADRERRRAWLAEQERIAAAAQAVAIEKANRRWDRALPVDGPNAYLERKQVAPHMARQEGDNLLIPMWDAAGELVNLQTITPQDGGRKLFQADAPTIGARFYIGIGWSRTIICEGFATGASIYEAMVDRVCVAFSQGQVENMAREMMAAGHQVIIAADRKALSAMEKIGAALNVPVIAPPLLAKGDDFNDQMIEQGVEAVAATFRQGLLDFANKPEPPPPAPPCAIDFVDAMDFAERDIPVRPWLVPGALLAGSTHILAAPGGTGKSVFTLQLAMMLASGKPWAKWSPKRACRVLVINAEDDIAEQRRRIAAARTVMELDSAVMRGRIMLADAPGNILISSIDPARKVQVATPLVEQLVDTIRHYKIDVVIVDPFAETFDGDENSNSDTKWAMKIWRDQIARPTGAAVYLVHHTTKGSEDKAGSADVIRGGGAIVNSARLAATLFVMSKAECGALAISEEERFRYVRYDDAKSNNSLIGGRSWFEKVSVILQNGPDGSAGDEVGALRPWEPVETDTGLSPELLMGLIEAVDAGYVDADGIATDLPFLRSGRGGTKRAIGDLIANITGLEGADGKRLLDNLLGKKLLVEREYRDENHDRFVKGIFADMAVAKAVFGG